MRIKHIFLILSLLLSVNLFAQHNEEITIEGTYRPKVNKVDKLLAVPETPKPSFEMPGTEIHTLDIEHRFPLELDKLTPLSYNGKNAQTPEAAKNFLMAGFGSRISPVFLYKHNSNLTKNLGLGVGIKHYSSWLDIKDYAPSSFMNNAFDISLTSSKYKNVQLGGKVYYINDMYHRYGVNLKDNPLTPADIDTYCGAVTYNTIGTHFGLVSNSTRAGEWSHSGSVDVRYTFDNTYGDEVFAGAEYGLGYTQSWWGDKNHPQKVGVDLGFQYDCYDATHEVYSLPTLNRNDLFLLKINPFFEMNDEFYKLHLGVRLDGVNRIQNKDKFLAVRPDIRGSLYVLNKKLEFYAGLNGGRKLLTYYDIITENPFAGCDYALLAQNVKLGFDGGLRTNIAEVVDLHLGVRYRHTDNDPMYVNTFSSGLNPINNIFKPVYDETQQVSVLGDLRMRLLDGFVADLGVAYHHYKLSFFQHAWNRPTLEGSVKLSYAVGEKLSLNTSFLYQGGRYTAFVYPNTYPGQVVGVEKLDDVYDLGLGADYKVQDQFSVFVKANNLLNRKYQLYYDYPVSGIEFFAGLKMTF